MMQSNYFFYIIIITAKIVKGQEVKEVSFSI